MTVQERALLRDRVARASIPAEHMPPDRPEYRTPAHKQRARWQRDRGWRLAYCAYCGKRIRSERGKFMVGLTCIDHADLPALDWRYAGGRLA